VALRGRVDRGPQLRIAAEFEADQRVVVAQGRADEVFLVVADGDERTRSGLVRVQGGEVGRDVRQGARGLPGPGRVFP
jgi:hypothetical protein